MKNKRSKQSQNKKKMLKNGNIYSIITMGNKKVRSVFIKMATLVKKPKSPNYLKPDLNNLNSRKRRRLIQFIRELPDPPTKKLSANVEKYIEDALKRRNGD